MNIVALICARGGSKGLPGKNIKPLAGIPLIGRAILKAQQVSRVRRVIVSTDCPEIAAIAKSFGADVPFVRPTELAADNSPEWLVWRHALEFLKNEEGSLPDALLVVPTTAPLRSVVDLENCIDLYASVDTDVVITVSNSHRSPYFNMVKVDSTGCSQLVIPPNEAVSRRQDAPAVFDITTVGYVARPSFVMSQNGIFEGKVRQVLVPTERALDIDTPFDFKIAEALIGADEALK